MFKKNKKKRTSIAIDFMVIDAIRKMANKQNRSLSNYIEVLLQKHLEEIQKGKQKEIK
jgi:hypothetical protein